MITDVNPFVYSHPVAAEDVIDRDAETLELLKNVVGGHFVRLYAPRKYGKTSLLKRALRDGEAEEGLIPILVDLYRVSSIADVTVRLERAYSKQLKGAVRTKIEDFLQKTGIGVSLGAYGISAKLQLDPKVDPLPALHALLDLPLRLEESGGYRAFVALDDFQDVGKVPNLDGLIRSHIQHQSEVASYDLAGSEPALMRQLFKNKDRPQGAAPAQRHRRDCARGRQAHGRRPALRGVDRAHQSRGRGSGLSLCDDENRWWIEVSASEHCSGSARSASGCRKRANVSATVRRLSSSAAREPSSWCSRTITATVALRSGARRRPGCRTCSSKPTPRSSSGRRTSVTEAGSASGSIAAATGTSWPGSRRTHMRRSRRRSSSKRRADIPAERPRTRLSWR